MGSVQLENGFLVTSSPGVRTSDGPETLIRLGLLEKTELRLYVPDYDSLAWGIHFDSRYFMAPSLEPCLSCREWAQLIRERWRDLESVIQHREKGSRNNLSGTPKNL